MTNYRVALTASAEKELRRLPARLVTRIFRRLDALAYNPRPHNCKKLVGGDKQWRIRVGEYRIVYEIDDYSKAIDVTRIAHRREVYRDR